MDGLVSTGKQIPYTILKIIFAITKKKFNYFINILNRAVDKEESKIIAGSNYDECGINESSS